MATAVFAETFNNRRGLCTKVEVSSKLQQQKPKDKHNCGICRMAANEMTVAEPGYFWNVMWACTEYSSLEDVQYNCCVLLRLVIWGFVSVP
jgi:hypothetical protein